MRFKLFSELYDQNDDDPVERQLNAHAHKRGQKRQQWLNRNDWNAGRFYTDKLSDLRTDPDETIPQQFVRMFQEKHPDLWCRLVKGVPEMQTNPENLIQNYMATYDLEKIYAALISIANRLPVC